ncbi:ferrous iron transport protein B [Sedimentibacter sp. zth1]|uniref:ferrous iron transport protein B n=1 Tax=Sedimentibacter sp. zth1 TaxID=2816908 RepID=UPI001A931BC4|nr:ferrous iron transport protein B [Sedimentibacter sp. zth1]QSX05019.1 ferrous iron transport protein B [Sedimentibacter sp. zth1]
MNIKLALVGNPNSGKTTMFNALTGSSQYVGNWPGVTVEKKVGKLEGHKDIDIVDLPGIYSLSPYTLEEVVSRNYLIDEKPDAIINIVDSTNIERNLYLTTQLLEVGIPVVIALNMVDVLRKKGDEIDKRLLKNFFGCEVIETSALRNEGCDDIIDAAIKVAKNKNHKVKHCKFSDSIENTISKIGELIDCKVEVDNKRWYAIKLFEHDEKIIDKIGLSKTSFSKINEISKNYEMQMNDDSETIITSERYMVIDTLVKEAVKKKNKTKITVTDKIDNIITNKYAAIPIFAIIMFLVYYVSISTVGSMMTDWVNDVLFAEIISPSVSSFLISVDSAQWLNSLIVDGIIGGVGAVIGFLPQMLVLFFFLAILEDCGYMSRIAFIMDRVFRNFGLSGKSFIPMLIATGCSVPGIMASRTIESESDRKITIITTSFIPCSAKLPIIALIAGALFRGAPWVAPVAYFVGIFAVLISGVILKKTTGFVGEETPFVMELPQYHVPRAKDVFKHTWDRGKSFVKKAGTVIFLACGIIWFLSTFNWSMQMVDTKDSILASIGRVIAPIFSPLGFGNWQSTVATLTGLVAKENVVGTFGILFNFAEVAENGVEVWPILQNIFTQASAFSFLIFNLLCAPCVAAIGAIRKEMGSAKWTLAAIGYQTGFAYAVSLIVYQTSMLLKGQFSLFTGIAIVVLVFMIYMIIKPSSKSRLAKGV